MRCNVLAWLALLHLYHVKESVVSAPEPYQSTPPTHMRQRPTCASSAPRIPPANRLRHRRSSPTPDTCRLQLLGLLADAVRLRSLRNDRSAVTGADEKASLLQRLQKLASWKRLHCFSGLAGQSESNMLKGICPLKVAVWSWGGQGGSRSLSAGSRMW